MGATPQARPIRATFEFLMLGAVKVKCSEVFRSATDGPSVTTPGRRRRGAVVGGSGSKGTQTSKSGARIRKRQEPRDYFVPWLVGWLVGWLGNRSSYVVNSPSGGKEPQHHLSLAVRRSGVLAPCPFRPGCATSADIIATDRPPCEGRRGGRNVSPKGVHRT